MNKFIEKLDNIKLGNKILLILGAPILMVIIFAFTSVNQKYGEFQSANFAGEIVGLSSVLDGIAHNFAVERGLSAGFLASGGKRGGDKLKKQRELVDQKVTELDRYLVENPADEFISNDIQGLQEQIKQRATVRSKVDSVASDSGSFKFYSSINATSLNLILKLATQITNPELTKHFNAYVSMLWLKERAGQERGVLNGVFVSGNTTSEKNTLASNLYANQQAKLDDFKRSANPSQLDLLKSVESDSSSASVITMRNVFQTMGAKLALLAELSSEAGYGGIIHNFKNYVLRNNAKYKPRIEKNYSNILAIVDRYKALKGVTDSEKEQLDIVADTFKKYYEAAQTAERDFASGDSSQNIDGRIKISDGPAIGAIKSLSKISGVDAADWFAASTKRINNVKRVTQEVAGNINDTVSLLMSSSLTSLLMVAGISALMIILVSWFGLFIGRRLVRNIMEIVDAIKNVQVDNDFSRRIDVHTKEEVGSIGAAFNSLIAAQQSAIKEVNVVMDAVGKGDFSLRVNSAFTGDLNTLKEGVNCSADSVETTMNALGDVMEALSGGDFKARMSNDVEGEFRNKVDNAMIAMDEALKEIGNVMEGVKQGDFSQRVASELPGELDILKGNINQSLMSLEDAMNDIVGTASAQQNGDLSKRVLGAYPGELGVKNHLA